GAASVTGLTATRARTQLPSPSTPYRARQRSIRPIHIEANGDSGRSWTLPRALASGASRLTFLFRHLVMDGFTGPLDVRDPTAGFGAGLLFGRHIKGVRQKVRFVCQITAGPCVIIRGAEKCDLGNRIARRRLSATGAN